MWLLWCIYSWIASRAVPNTAAAGAAANNRRNIIKNCAPFSIAKGKINNTQISNA